MTVAARVLGDTPLHPAPLYQSAAAASIFVLLLMLERRKPPRGTIVFSLLAAMGLQRFLVEFVRFNTGNEVLFEIGPWTARIFLTREPGCADDAEAKSTIRQQSGGTPIALKSARTNPSEPIGNSEGTAEAAEIDPEPRRCNPPNRKKPGP